HKTSPGRAPDQPARLPTSLLAGDAMRLATLHTPAGPRAAAFLDHSYVDLHATDPALPARVRQLLEGGEPALRAAAQAARHPPPPPPPPAPRPTLSPSPRPSPTRARSCASASTTATTPPRAEPPSRANPSCSASTPPPSSAPVSPSSCPPSAPRSITRPNSSS